jgi:hypothetical protein
MEKMKVRFLVVSLLVCNSLIAQVTPGDGFVYYKEFNKDVLFSKAKAFLIKDVLGSSEVAVQFEIEPLSTTTAKEVCSIAYKSDGKAKEGLLLGFYGDYWTSTGVLTQGFGFKNLPKVKAIGLLSVITRTIDERKDYISKDSDNNNVYFVYDDITVLIYNSTETKIRIIWKSFDAEWSLSAFKSALKRFEKT